MKNNIFVITASNAEAYKNYIDTIEEGVDLARIKPHVSKNDFEKIKSLFQNQPIRMWGSVPGTNTKRTFKKIRVGDPLLIYREGNFEYRAFINFQLKNRELAEAIWGTDSNGNTWEQINFMEDLTPLSVPVSVYNKLAGYSANYTPQGFHALSKKVIKHVIDGHGSIDGFLNALVDVELSPESEVVTPKQKKGIQYQENDIEDYLEKNIELLEEGLTLIKRQKNLGDAGTCDLLCKDKNQNYVVVELKKDKAETSVIAQAQRYMGYVAKNIRTEEEKNTSVRVRGIIVATKFSPNLRYSVAGNENLEIRTYSVKPVFNNESN